MLAPQKEIGVLPASPEQDERIAPLVTLQNAIRYWWFVSLAIVVGGLLAWLLYSTRAPVYEAVGHFSANIDYVATGPMSQLDEDIAINAIGDLVASQATLTKVVEAAKAAGITTSIPEIKRSSTFERRVNVWDLRMRSTDPKFAEQLANIWIDQGQADLEAAYTHAVKAEQLNRYLQSLETCLGKLAISEPSGGLCTAERVHDIQADMNQTGQLLTQERKDSREIFSGLRLSPADHAVISAKPVLYGRNQMIIAGALIGLVLGVWMVQAGIPARFAKKR